MITIHENLDDLVQLIQLADGSESLEEVLNHEQGNNNIRLIIVYEQQNPHFLGVISPFCESESEHNCVVQTVFKLGNGFRKTSPIGGRPHFQTLSKLSLHQFGKKFEIFRNAQVVPCYEFRLEKDKPIYTIEEVAVATTLECSQLEALLVNDFGIREYICQVEGNTYLAHSLKKGLNIFEYITQREEYVLKYKNDLVRLGSQTGSLSPNGWDSWVAQTFASSKNKVPTSQDIIFYFQTWRKFLNECHYGDKRPSITDKKSVIEFGCNFAAKFGFIPNADVWNEEPNHPYAADCRQLFGIGSFDELVVPEIQKEAMQRRIKIVPTEIKEHIAALHLQGMEDKEIGHILQLPKERVQFLLKQFSHIPSETIGRLHSTDALSHLLLPHSPSYFKPDIYYSMVEAIINNLSQPENISYLGLEGPYFGSFRYLSDWVGINKHKSLVPEFHKKSSKAMESIISHAHLLRGGEKLSGVKHCCASLERVVEETPLQFNVCNLDYLGPITQKKITTLYNMFHLNKLEDEAVIFITLNNSKRRKVSLTRGNASWLGERHIDGFPTDDQATLYYFYTTQFARQHNYELKEIVKKTYQIKQTEMLLLGYWCQKRTC